MQSLRISIIKYKSQLRVPCKSSSVNADMQTQTETICQKEAPKTRSTYSKHFYLYQFFLALKILREYLFLQTR